MPAWYISAQHRVAGRCFSRHNVCSKKAIEREAWSTLDYCFSCLSFKSHFCIFALLAVLQFFSAGCQHHWSLTVPEWHLPLVCAWGEMVTLCAKPVSPEPARRHRADHKWPICPVLLPEELKKQGAAVFLRFFAHQHCQPALLFGRAGLPCEVRM